MIPLNDVVKVYKSETRDAWGIVTNEAIATELRCMVKYSTAIQELKNAKGETIVVTASIVFKGKVDIDFNSLVSIPDGIQPNKKFDVGTIQPIKDIAGETLFTRVVI